MTKTHTYPTSQYELLHATFNERARRIYLGTEARKLGNISRVAKVSGSDRKTIARGVVDSDVPLDELASSRIRLLGDGRKRIIDTDPTLDVDLESLLDPKGRPDAYRPVDNQVGRKACLVPTRQGACRYTE
jgi:hypothetical protein